MASDIALYNARNAKTQCLVNQNLQCICAPLYCTLNQAGGTAGGTAKCLCFCGICVYPLLTGATSFNVCDTNLIFKGGACCLWTVPAGVTKVQFQMWGGGAGNSSGNCCSISPFGASGAYAVTTITTAPGCQYTLCAGCGGCGTSLYYSGTPGTRGCASFVTGYGLSGFCAEGGLDSLTAEYNHVLCLNSAMTSCCRYTNSSLPAGGNCICADGSLCVGNACCSDPMPPAYMTNTFKGTNSSPFCSIFPGIYGIPGMMGCACYCGMCGIFLSPPLVGTTHCFCCTFCMCFNVGQAYVMDQRTSCNFGCSWGSNYGSAGCTCGYVNSSIFGYWADACRNFLCTPGAGGHATLYNNVNCWCGSCGGDGRSGMVRVSYC